MSNTDKAAITRALISVSDKTDLLILGRFLDERGIEILSTGGSAKALRDGGVSVTDVAEHTGFPEIMDGRVKTLHPLIHGGLLARRDDNDHLKAMADHGIAPIDLVVINLYPFEETVASGAGAADVIENIDIGGPSMVRSAAKNHAFVTIVTDPADYQSVIADIKENDGATSLELRRRLAAKAFTRTAAYDSAISTWFNTQEGDTFPSCLTLAGTRAQILRYGENPHQEAAFYKSAEARPGIATATQIQGKELSYNNLNDTDAAFELVAEFDQPAIAIIKHANPCGVAIGKTPFEAYKKALACDPVSAFGGIVALNRGLDGETAQAIAELFVEVVIAPEISTAARDALAAKKNVRLLETGAMPDPAASGMTVKSLAGGYLFQSRDKGCIQKADLKTVTKRAPSDSEMADLLFAFRVCKHVKSNAIVYVKDGATVGIGAGQMSRIDSARIAAIKSNEAAENAGETASRTEGCVVASDAFFPFADGLLAAASAGASAVIQPGGSMRDDEVIKAADEKGLAMVMTGMRHFRH